MVHIMKKFIILIILAFCSLPALAQTNKTSAYKIRTVGGNFVVTYQGKAHKIKTLDYVDAAKVTGTKILFVSHINKFTYLLIDVTGQSKAKQDDRQCGAGIESNLIRVKLNSKWAVSEMDGVRYESCWSSIDSEGYEIKGRILSLEFDNSRDDENVKLKYDADNPEGAFQITKKKIE
jgi:uncharacterized protein YdeI (BOF family)